MRLRLRALGGILGLVAVVVSLAFPVLAQDEPADGTTTTVADDTTTSLADVVPAVPVKPPDETSPQLDWTYRYMIPTTLALAVVVILLTTIRYFTNVVRRRYRTIGE